MDAFEAELARRQADPHEAELARRGVAPATPEPGLGEKALGLAKAAGSGVVKGVTELPQLPITLERGSLALQDYLASRFGGEKPQAPTPAQAAVNQAQDEFRAGRDATLHAPATTAEKYAETIGEFAPAAFAGPGSLVRRAVADVAIPAAASETAGQAAEHAKMSPVVETIARIAAGGAANVGSALSRLRASAPEHAIVRAARGVEPQEWDAAAQLQRNSPVALTGPEAVDQVTGGATRLGDVMRVVEGSSGGGAVTKRFFSERPAQVDAAVNQALDTISPRAAEPSSIGPQAADTAERALGDVRRGINNATRPLYQAAENQTVPNSNFGPAFEESLRRLREDPVVGPRFAHLPDNSIGVIDAVTKDMAARGEAHNVISAGPEGFNPLRAGDYREGAGTTREIARNASPEYDTALAAQEQARRQNLNPLERGPLGQVAQSTNTTQAGAAVLPHDPLTGMEGEVATAIQRIAQRDPPLASALVRQRLADRWDATGRDLQGGENQWGGAKFAKDVAGTEQQRRNLTAALGGLPLGPQRTAPLALDDLLESLRATGQRKAPGSPTEPNRQLTKELGHAPLEADLALTPVMPTRFWQRTGDLAQQAWLGRNTATLADLFTRPDSVSRLQEIAMHAREHPALAALLRQAYETPLEVRQ